MNTQMSLKVIQTGTIQKLWYGFCRAMLCISAIYAVMRCPSVRPSVCLSRSWIMSKRINLSSNFFFSPFQFFHTKRGGDIPTGTTLTRASNARGYEKMSIFEQYLALSPKCCNTEPQLLQKANRKPHASFRMVPF